MVKSTSIKPSKQRKLLQHLHNHQVSKVFTVPLDKTLQEEWGIQRLPVRKGDSVKVVKGEFVDIEGKVLTVLKKTHRVTIEEVTRQKKDGSNYYVPVSTSKLILTKFGEKKMDQWREKMINRKIKLEIISGAPKKGGKTYGK